MCEVTNCFAWFDLSTQQRSAAVRRSCVPTVAGHRLVTSLRDGGWNTHRSAKRSLSLRRCPWMILWKVWSDVGDWLRCSCHMYSLDGHAAPTTGAAWEAASLPVLLVSGYHTGWSRSCTYQVGARTRKLQCGMETRHLPPQTTRVTRKSEDASDATAAVNTSTKAGGKSCVIACLPRCACGQWSRQQVHRSFRNTLELDTRQPRLRFGCPNAHKSNATFWCAESNKLPMFVAVQTRESCHAKTVQCEPSMYLCCAVSINWTQSCSWYSPNASNTCSNALETNLAWHPRGAENPAAAKRSWDPTCSAPKKTKCAPHCAGVMRWTFLSWDRVHQTSAWEGARWGTKLRRRVRWVHLLLLKSYHWPCCRLWVFQALRGSQSRFTWLHTRGARRRLHWHPWPVIWY